MALIVTLLFGCLAARELTIPLTGENEVIDLNYSHLQVDSQGRIYLADRRNSRILVFSSSGERLAAFGKAGEGPGDFKRWFGSFAITEDDRVLQIDSWGGNRSISCFSADGKLLWVHKIQKEGYFGTEAIYPLKDGRLILEIGYGMKQTPKGELLFMGTQSTFFLADEQGKLDTELHTEILYSDFSDQSGRGWPRLPFQVERISAFDPLSNRLAYQKTNEAKVHILNLTDMKTTDIGNGFSVKPLTSDLVRAEVREMMKQRGREQFTDMYKKLQTAGATIESHLPIVSALNFTDKGDLLIGCFEEETKKWTLFILDTQLKLNGPKKSDYFPSVIRNGEVYSLCHSEEEDIYLIQIEPWIYRIGSL